MTELYRKKIITGSIESAGTENWNAGKRADTRSVLVAARRGIDISDHRARQIRPDDFERFDIIYVMDRANERALKQIAPPGMACKIKRIRKGVADSSDADVPDPYHGTEAHFEQVFEMLMESCNAVADEISKK